MKLLIVSPIYPPEIGGPATYILGLKKHLPRSISISVVSFSQKALKRNKLTLIGTDRSVLERQGEMFLQSYRNAKQSDLVYILEPLVVGLSAVLSSLIAGKKTIIKFVGDPCWEEYRRLNPGGCDLYKYYNSKKYLGSWRYWITLFNLQLCSQIIIPSEHLKAFLIRSYFLKSSKTIVIHNAVDVPLKTKKVKNSIIYCGRLVPWKNVDLIIESLKKITIFNCCLKIVGEGPDRKKLALLVNRLNLESKVQFLGLHSAASAAKEIGKSEILVLYSDYEGLSHVILEAMSQGTVVVASDIPGNDEVVVNHTTGYLVKHHDTKLLASKINYLFRRREILKKMSSSSIDKIKLQFGWTSNINQLVSIFNGIVKK